MNSELFAALKLRARNQRSEAAIVRVARLKKLLNWVQKNEEKILGALYSDFGKPQFETFLSEIYPVLTELKYFIKNISGFMKDKKVQTPIVLFGHSSRIRYENKGVVLIISPWNYPFQLAATPLIAALASGNTAVIKPSELTPATSLLIKQMIEDCFTADEVSVELGDKIKTQELLSFYFDHVFFTGSTAVGKTISLACAERLIPVTLELGGKSTTIIDETADLLNAAERIFWAKFLNRGQSCIAPNHILIQETVAPQFVSLINDLIEQNRHSEKAGFINENYHSRLKTLCNRAVNLNEKAVELLELDNATHPAMDEEIFGPVLPILRFKEFSELETLIGSNAQPLSLYVFSSDENRVKAILERFPSGGVGINSVMLQFGNHHLPFGGIGESGSGKYHGYHGFLEMSHQRAVIEQKFFSLTRRLLLPPYTTAHNLIIKVLRYL